MPTKTDPSPQGDISSTEQFASADIVEQRKADHIRINIEEDVAFKGLTTGLEQYYLVHQALPELDFATIDTSTQLLGKTLSSPLLISSMTGGTSEAHEINVALATAAQEIGIAMGLGSVRASFAGRSLLEGSPELESARETRERESAAAATLVEEIDHL